MLVLYILSPCVLKQSQMNSNNQSISEVLAKFNIDLDLELPQSTYAGLYTLIALALIIVLYILMRQLASPYDGVRPVF